MKTLFVVSLVSFLYFFSVRNASAKAVINEVFPNPKDNEAGAEWVELYNLSSDVTSLSGCVLFLHESDNSQRVEFSDDDFIDGVDKYRVISWNDSWLNNSGDKVRFICPSFNDEVAYGDANGSIVDSPKEGFSIGRSPDGTGGFSILSTVTLGSQNSQPPTSTPVPTNTPAPTSKPTSTPTLVPTNTSTPTPTRIPTKTPTPSERSTEDEEASQILGVEENEAGVDEEKELESEVEGKSVFPLASVAFILTGLGLIGFPVVNYIRMKRGYNQKDD